MKKRHGFSLVELLVVIGILAALVAILIPVFGKVRTASQATDTANTVMALGQNIEAFKMQNGSYPGAFPYTQLNLAAASMSPAVTDFGGTGPIGFVTGAENLLVSLNGGIRTIAAGTLFDQSDVGKGPLKQPFVVGSTARQQAFAPSLKTSEAGKKFTYAETVAANDSIIPEFIDGFGDPLPILYLKARVGVTTSSPGTAADNPVVTDGTGARVGPYDISQIVGYTTSGIGITPHGLQSVNTAATLAAEPYDAYPYFANPNIANTPRQKDGFILISAGKDRKYGTADDITNFGSVKP